MSGALSFIYVGNAAEEADWHARGTPFASLTPAHPTVSCVLASRELVSGGPLPLHSSGGGTSPRACLPASSAAIPPVKCYQLGHIVLKIDARHLIVMPGSDRASLPRARKRHFWCTNPYFYRVRARNTPFWCTRLFVCCHPHCHWTVFVNLLNIRQIIKLLPSSEEGGDYVFYSQ